MVNKTISLTEEMFNKLKGEENASALIDGLLREFYKYNIQDIEEINKEIDKLREKEKESGNKIENELEKLERIKNRVEGEIKEKAERVEKAKLWLEEFKSKFKTEEDMNEFVSNASEQLKQKYKRAREYGQ